jgi:hypothetical protein
MKDNEMVTAAIIVADARDWVSDCVDIPDGATSRAILRWVDGNWDGALEGFCATIYGTRWGNDARNLIRSTWNI